jgi:hypothetical protein
MLQYNIIVGGEPPFREDLSTEAEDITIVRSRYQATTIEL